MPLINHGIIMMLVAVALTMKIIQAKLTSKSSQLSPYEAQECYRLNMTNCVATYTNCEAWKQQVRICTMLKSHNPFVRPGIVMNSDGQPPAVNVWSSIKLRAINRISDHSMDFTAEFRLTQKWFDTRLSFDTDNTRFIDLVWLAHDQKIWIPDTFFQNEKNGWYHKIDSANKYTKIRSDGLVTYNTRLTLVLSCLLDLRKYPMDTQYCHIDFSSYAYTADDINYVWDGRPITAHKNATRALPSFKVLSMLNQTCTSTTSTGTYSCLRVAITFKRVLSAFMLQLYIPSTMLVVVSWLSYWLDWKAVAARVPLDVITLLAMITTANAANAKLPPVAYTKAMDVWIGACVSLIFFALMEYAVVQYVGASQSKKQATGGKKDTEWHVTSPVRHKLHNTGTQTMITCVQTAGITNECTTHSTPEHEQEQKGLLANLSSALRQRRREHTMREAAVASPDMRRAAYDQPVHFNPVERHLQRMTYRKTVTVQLVKWCGVLRTQNKAERIDVAARILVPVVFIGFNIVYWTSYMFL